MTTTEVVSKLWRRLEDYDREFIEEALGTDIPVTAAHLYKMDKSQWQRFQYDHWTPDLVHPPLSNEDGRITVFPLKTMLILWVQYPREDKAYRVVIRQ